MDPHRSDNGMPGYAHQGAMEQQSNYYPSTAPPVSYGHPAPATYIGMGMSSHAPPQSPLSAQHDSQHMGISTYDSGHLQAMHHMGHGNDPSLFDVQDHHMPMMSGSYVGGVMAPSLPSNMGMSPMIHSPMQANPYSMQDMGGHLSPTDDGSFSGLSPGPFTPDFSAQQTNNVLTEFTKRRNWPQRVLEEVPDFIHVLSSDGKILYAAPSCKSMVGFPVEELIGKTLVDFIHEDDAALFLLEFNDCMKRNTDFRMFFRLRTKSSGYSVFDVEGHPHFTGVSRNFHGGPRLPDPSSAQMGDCAGFFMNARPYPSRNMVLLDSFLEHRIENVRLNQRVNDLKLEEEEDAHGYGQMSPGSYGESTPRGYAGSITPISTGTMQSAGGGGLRSPTSPMGQGLTKQNLDVAGSESIDDRMARYGANTANAEAIEMFTGLRYNERSKGISTGATSPALIRGDAGVPLPTESHSRHMGDKKKKIKVTEDYVCTDCATLESPEWRKGPKGPKTLCNACGLRWAKREKKKQADMAAQQGTASAK